MLKKSLPFLLFTFLPAFFSVSHAEITHTYNVTVTTSDASADNDKCPTPDIEGDYDFTSPCIATLKLFTVGQMYQSKKAKNAVYDKAKEGAFDHTGQLIIPIKYDKLNTFYTDIAGVKLGKKWALINSKGKIITPFIYDDIDDFSENHPLAIIKQGKKYGVVNDQLIIIIPLEFDDIQYIDVVEDDTNRLFAVQKAHKWALFDKTGKQLTDFNLDDYKQSYSFYEGLLGVKSQGQWGYMDTQGKWVIPPMYKDVDTVVHGLLAVESETGIGFVDKHNKVIIPLKYDTFWEAEKGKIRVKSANDFYLYDKNGNKVSQ